MINQVEIPKTPESALIFAVFKQSLKDLGLTFNLETGEITKAKTSFSNFSDAYSYFFSDSSYFKWHMRLLGLETNKLRERIRILLKDIEGASK